MALADYLSRLGASLGGADALADYDNSLAKRRQQSELSGLADNPELARNPALLAQRIAQATGDPNALLKWAEMVKPQGPEYQIIQSGNGGYVVVDKNNPFKPAATYGAQGGASPQSGLGKLRADLEAGLIDPDTYKAAVKKDTERAPRAYNQPQQQAAAFADRVINASKIIDSYETGGEGGKPKIDLVNNTSSALAQIPSFGLGGFLANANLNDDQQQYKNAAEQWIRANLRKESGAAISDKEMEQEYRNYFPVAGDSDAVIAQKRQLRATTANTLVQQSAGAYDEQYGAPVAKTEAKKPLSQLSTQELLARLKK